MEPWAAAANAAVPVAALLPSRAQEDDTSLPYACMDVLTVTQCLIAIASGLIYVIREVWLRRRFLKMCDFEAEDEVPIDTEVPAVPDLPHTARPALNPADFLGTLEAAGPGTPRDAVRRRQSGDVGTSIPDDVEPEDYQPELRRRPRERPGTTDSWLALASIPVMASVLLWHVSQGLYVLPGGAGPDSTTPARDWTHALSQLPRALHRMPDLQDPQCSSA